ncbi:MAG: TetR/AcrR family transcriptional regulator [Lachnospiraceae bacterium]|nr:TetR/AcrR family transcriptional regulator [Lachnospiraceae bacterium]
MGEDKETRIKLLDSAKQEFLEKGYMKASLRAICKNAGVTTGALYFFFQDKEDLLKNLVEEPLKELISRIQSHFLEEMNMESPFVSIQDDSADIKAAREIVHFMYQNYDIFQILLTKSQGSAYEDITSRFADRIEEHYNTLAERMAERFGIQKPDHYMIHWLSHIQIDSFIHLLTHEQDEEKAVRHIGEIVVYLLSGWNGLFLPKR